MGRVMATAGALGLFLLSGCATQARRQYQAISTNITTASEQIQACATAVYNSTEAASLRPHMPLKAFDDTLEQMSDS
jgi:outer membrane murein-binding lipoprotein Lpp